MQFVVALLKKLPIGPIVMLIVGLVLGLLIGWQIAPVEFINATPAYLRADLQEDYLRMAIDSFRVNSSPDLAVQRWNSLGVGAQQAYLNIQQNPGNQDPAVVKAFGDLITSILATNPPQPETSGSSSLLNTALIGVAIILVLGVLAAGGMYLFRLFGRRGSGEVTTMIDRKSVV